MARTDRRDDMWILIEGEGPFVVEMHTDDEASTVGRYWNAVGVYRRTGEITKLLDFEGVTVAGHRLETDLDEIDYWARRGDLAFEDIYES